MEAIKKIEAAAKLAAFPNLYLFVSAALFAWAIWFVPLDILDQYSHATNPRDFLLHTPLVFAQAIRTLFPNTWLAHISDSWFGAIYFAVLIAGYVWLVVSIKNFYENRTQRLYATLSEIDAVRKELSLPTPVEPLMNGDGSSSADPILGAGVGAAAGAGGALGLSAVTGGLSGLGSLFGPWAVSAFPAAAASGPPGWVVIAAAAVGGLVGLALGYASRENASSNQVEAQQTSSKVNEYDQALIRTLNAFRGLMFDLIGQNNQEEQRSATVLKLGGIFLLVLIILNYGIPWIISRI